MEIKLSEQQVKDIKDHLREIQDTILVDTNDADAIVLSSTILIWRILNNAEEVTNMDTVLMGMFPSKVEGQTLS